MTIMATKERCPRWVIVATLLVIAMFSVMGILNLSGIMPLERISLSNEYGESASTSYNPYGYLLNVISIIVFITIAILSMVKKWSRFIFLGAILLILDNFIALYDYVTLLSIDDCGVLLERIRNWQMASIMETALYLAGCILIFLNTDVSKFLKIVATVFVVLFALLGFIHFVSNTAYFMVYVIKAIIAIVLSFFCFSKSIKV